MIRRTLLSGLMALPMLDSARRTRALPAALPADWEAFVRGWDCYPDARAAAELAHCLGYCPADLSSYATRHGAPSGRFTLVFGDWTRSDYVTVDGANAVHWRRYRQAGRRVP